MLVVGRQLGPGESLRVEGKNQFLEFFANGKSAGGQARRRRTANIGKQLSVGRDVGPFVLYWIVERTSVGEGEIAIEVLPSCNDGPAISQHGRCDIQRHIAGRA